MLNCYTIGFLAMAVALISAGIALRYPGRKGLALAKWALGIGCSLALLLPILFFALGTLSIGPQKYLEFDEKIVSPDGTAFFALYHDYGGIGDPDWHVFKLPADEAPEKVKIPTTYGSDANGTWKSRMLMWNFSEAGNHTSNPHIKIFGQRYLVFTRGGYYHGLYDIRDGKTLITDTSPWHSLVATMRGDSGGMDRRITDIDARMDSWVEDTLHNPIKKIIENSD